MVKRPYRVRGIPAHHAIVMRANTVAQDADMGVAATADRNAKVQEQSPDGGPASARR